MQKLGRKQEKETNEASEAFLEKEVATITGDKEASEKELQLVSKQLQSTHAEYAQLEAEANELWQKLCSAEDSIASLTEQLAHK